MWHKCLSTVSLNITVQLSLYFMKISIKEYYMCGPIRWSMPVPLWKITGGYLSWITYQLKSIKKHLSNIENSTDPFCEDTRQNALAAVINLGHLDPILLLAPPHHLTIQWETNEKIILVLRGNFELRPDLHEILKWQQRLVRSYLCSRIRIPRQSERHTEVTQNCRPFILICTRRDHTFPAWEKSLRFFQGEDRRHDNVACTWLCLR